MMLSPSEFYTMTHNAWTVDRHYRGSLPFVLEKWPNDVCVNTDFPTGKPIEMKAKILILWTRQIRKKAKERCVIPNFAKIPPHQTKTS